ncbi:MAG TPA: epoxide hydrolase [Thermoanaerobaculia bacterium]|nr:epoxide hydrolase [Thermoanaerobaculia bacterium]
MTIRPFRFHAPEAVLADLRRRLESTRWPDEVPRSGWDYGANLGALRDLAASWRDGFDWRAQEERINRLPHFRAEIDGLGIHFLHYRGRGPDPLPILLLHGWPSSFLEMVGLAPRLADPASSGGAAGDAFDVVVPSLPGIGFSDRPQAPGMTKTRMGALFTRLMVEGLGHARFAVRGGDIGSGVAAWMGVDYPEQVLGIHVSDVLRPGLGPESPPLTAAEQAFLAEEARWMEAEGAYDHVQRTKPQTLAYGLHDSPVGLLAWIVEKLRSWSDCGGYVTRRFSEDEILTLVTLYWVTETINSANRLYFERDRAPRFLAPGQRVEVPCAVTIFPADIDRPPVEWGRRAYNVQSWTEMPRGGHFAAHEEPELLARDLREFFRPLRAAT